MQKTVLLTGATGFLGSHLLKALVARGCKVVILKRSTSNTRRIQLQLAEIISYDVDTQPVELAFFQQKIDVVIHTACHYGRNGDSLSRVVDSNLMFGLAIMEAAIRFEVPVFFNADTLLPRALNAYTLSKKQFVDWLRNQSEHIQVVNLRVEHMYGPGDDETKFVPWILSQLKSNTEEIRLTRGEQYRDFVYIDDVASAFVTLMEQVVVLPRFTEFDVGTGRLVTIRSFLECLRETFERDIGPVATRLAFGALPYRQGEMMTVELDSAPLRSLGWSAATEIEDGLRRVIKEYQ
ncbi:NAD(P)-dependent oxidoreductase [Stutzerimonas xanthomarina]|nr:NAD(P)-dependent oxidoreductase [Stutzerimonas xanthomarina]